MMAAEILKKIFKGRVSEVDLTSTVSAADVFALPFFISGCKLNSNLVERKKTKRIYAIDG